MKPSRPDAARGMVRVHGTPSFCFVEVQTAKGWRFLSGASRKVNAQRSAGNIRAALRYAVQRDRAARGR